MNLQILIAQYITYRQALGEEQKSNGRTLRAFGRFIGEGVKIADVRPDQVETFLAGAKPITLNWHIKLGVLRAFYQYAISRRHTADAPLPTVLPKRPPAFVPHIYSLDEMRRLLHAAEADKRYRAIIKAETLHAVLLTFYATGLRVQELVALNREDVNFAGSTMEVRQSKFGKTRLIPFGLQLHRVLSAYCQQHAGKSDHDPFFVTRGGDRIKADTLQHNYRIICERAGVRRPIGARYQPRIHDLRHTFAVHRLTSWYREGADVQKLLPYLSIYLGHAHIRATQVYLTMTPELLKEAGARFEQYTLQGGCHD